MMGDIFHPNIYRVGVTPSEKGTAQAVPFEVLELPLREFPATGKPKAKAEPQELAAGSR